MAIYSLVFDIVMWMTIGLCIGFAARALVRGQSAMFRSMLVLFGITGAILGGGLGWLIWGADGETPGPAALARIGLSFATAIGIVGFYVVLAYRRGGDEMSRRGPPEH